MPPQNERSSTLNRQSSDAEAPSLKKPSRCIVPPWGSAQVILPHPTNNCSLTRVLQEDQVIV